MSYPIFRLDFEDKKVRENFIKKTNEIINNCDEEINKLIKEKEQIINILKENNIEIEQKTKLNFIETLKQKEITIYNLKQDIDIYRFTNNHYDEIKYIFHYYDNNELLK